MERLTKQEQESVVITMAIAIVLMLLLFFMKYYPPPEEKKEEIPVEVEIAQGLSGGGGGGGATINFGESGAGAKFQGSVSPPVEEVIGSNDDKAEEVANTSPVVNRGTRIENPKPQPDNTPKKPTNAALENMLGGSDASGGGNGNGISNGSYGAGGNGNGSGGGNGSGNGTGTGPGSGSGSGGGSGAGYGTGVGNYNLAGRKAIAKSSPEGCNEFGTVTVQITVDNTGKVIKAETGRGTNASPCLIKQAKAAALKWKFDSGKESQQVGQIVYNFKVTE